MTWTRGTAVMHHDHVFKEDGPCNERALVTAPHGSPVACEDGTGSAYGLFLILERGRLFIGPGVAVSQGMVVGQNSRDEHPGMNIRKTKHLTTMGASGPDEALTLTPPRSVTLEFAMDDIDPDGLVEVTAASSRIRKRLLNPDDARPASAVPRDAGRPTRIRPSAQTQGVTG